MFADSALDLVVDEIQKSMSLIDSLSADLVVAQADYDRLLKIPKVKWALKRADKKVRLLQSQLDSQQELIDDLQRLDKAPKVFESWHIHVRRHKSSASLQIFEY